MVVGPGGHSFLYDDTANNWNYRPNELCGRNFLLSTSLKKIENVPPPLFYDKLVSNL